MKTVITAGLALILTACGQGPSASDNAPVPSDHSVVEALTALRVSGDEAFMRAHRRSQALPLR